MFILFSPLCQTKHCVEKKIKLKDTNAKLNALITHFPQIVGENNFLQKKKCKIRQKLCSSTSSFLKDSLKVKIF